MRNRASTRTALFALTLIFSNLSRAALGGAPVNYGGAGQDESRSAAGSAIAESGAMRYTIRRNKVKDRVEIHQYVDASGQVFAVAWSGKTKPDLDELLGHSAFSTMVAGQSTSRQINRHSLEQRSNDLVIQSQSHGHLFRGRAWIPTMLPAGVSSEVVQ
ncbi:MULTISPECIES: DUF2844 domain-containing protein [Burkholderia cepacia complex]|uniref:DUF2844 domain-containing protein n=1 Tax=Burkholderia cepacia complex TaxID=87882 RepID=UPI00157AD45E|nr:MULTISPECIES: DUF2844 domain-containing protein [Burkholderia cepacia complex]NTY38475.1 DUF2844 domain-containing protein [Burkholderia diffusa]